LAYLTKICARTTQISNRTSPLLRRCHGNLSEGRQSSTDFVLRWLRSRLATPRGSARARATTPLGLRFERWAPDHLKDGFSLQEAAKALATSARSLQRRCQAVLGKSPLSYFQDLRVEHAQSLLHGSGLDLDAIAAQVGYIDGATLRTLLRQRLGRGVRDLRGGLR
jgi:transcriptional regulator GlxA family with amidase domain